MPKFVIPQSEFHRFGKLLREARENAGLTHQELAQRSGLREIYLRQTEAGRTKPKSLFRIASLVRALPSSSELARLVERWYQQSSNWRTVQRLAESQEFINRFPDLLREARENAGLSVRELARRSGMDATHLSRMERGLVPPPKWTKIAAIAGELPLSELSKHTEESGTERLKHSALELANDLEKLIVLLPATAFDDQVWVSAIQTRLRKCMMLVKASEYSVGRESAAAVGKQRH